MSKHCFGICELSKKICYTRKFIEHVLLILFLYSIRRINNGNEKFMGINEIFKKQFD